MKFEKEMNTVTTMLRAVSYIEKFFNVMKLEYIPEDTLARIMRSLDVISDKINDHLTKDRDDKKVQ